MEYKVEKPEDIKSVVVSSDEQEVVINFSRQESEATVYVSDNTVLTKMKKVWAKDPKGYTCTYSKDSEGNPVSYTFTTNKKNISIKATREKREYTQEEREKIAARFKEKRESKRR